MRNMIKKLRFTLLIVPIFALILMANSITVEKTIPQQIQISEILEFVINVETRSINVHLRNGTSGTLDTAEFIDFWNNTMTSTQRTVVRGFVKQLSALAFTVEEEKVIGDLMD